MASLMAASTMPASAQSRRLAKTSKVAPSLATFSDEVCNSRVSTGGLAHGARCELRTVRKQDHADELGGRREALRAHGGRGRASRLAFHDLRRRFITGGRGIGVRSR